MVCLKSLCVAHDILEMTILKYNINSVGEQKKASELKKKYKIHIESVSDSLLIEI